MPVIIAQETVALEFTYSFVSKEMFSRAAVLFQRPVLQGLIGSLALWTVRRGRTCGLCSVELTGS